MRNFLPQEAKIGVGRELRRFLHSKKNAATDARISGCCASHGQRAVRHLARIQRIETIFMITTKARDRLT